MSKADVAPATATLGCGDPGRPAERGQPSRASDVSNHAVFERFALSGVALELGLQLRQASVVGGVRGHLLVQRPLALGEALDRALQSAQLAFGALGLLALRAEPRAGRHRVLV